MRDGAFLCSMVARGWERNGLEQSAAAASAAARVSGCHVISGTLDDFDVDDNSYVIVHMSDVIEHVHDPRASLRRIRRLLESRRLLVLTTPDLGSLSARLPQNRWPNYKPEHLFYPDRTWITNLLASEGFRVRRITAASKALTLDFAFKYFGAYGPRFAWQVLCPLMPRLPRLLRDRPIKVTAGDMLVFAQPVQLGDHAKRPARVGVSSQSDVEQI